MPFTLALTGEDQNENIILSIDGKKLVLTFLPKSISEADKRDAAIKRDRFNFYISFYLSPFLQDHIEYDKTFDITDPFKGLPIQDGDGFSIFLSFKSNVNSHIIDILFDEEFLKGHAIDNYLDENKKKLDSSYFYKFISRFSRVKIKEAFKKYSEENKLDISIDENNLQSFMDDVLKDARELQSQIDGLVALESQIQQRISTLDKVKKELQPLECEVIRRDFLSKKGTESLQAEFDKDIYDQKIQEFDKKIEAMQSRVKNERDTLKDLKFTPFHSKFSKDIDLLFKHTDQLQDGERLQAISSIQKSNDKSRILLEKNIDRSKKSNNLDELKEHDQPYQPQKLLIYSSFSHQYEVQREMKTQNYACKDVYSDMVECPSVFFYNENIPDKDKENRLKATKIVDELLKKEEELRKQHGYK